MFCIKCGAGIADDSKFCTSCGEKIVTETPNSEKRIVEEAKKEEPNTRVTE